MPKAASWQGRLNVTPDNFTTHLPVISIDTRGQEILRGSLHTLPWMEDDMWTPDQAGIYAAAPAPDYAAGALPLEEEHEETGKIQTGVAFYGGAADGAQTNPFLRAPDIRADALISYRGRSSMRFDKKGLTIKLVDASGMLEDHQALFGMARHNEWALHGPYLDKTLLRNYMMYNVSAEIMEYAPNARFCEVFVDGEYQGVFLLLEKITSSDYGRVPITRVGRNRTQTSYILELVERQPPEGRSVLKNYSHYAFLMAVTYEFEVKYPAHKNITPAQLEYIQNDMSRFEKALYSYDYDSRESGFETMIDVDNFADYAIINLFCLNTDAGNLSTYLYKDLRGKFSLCVWDYNNVFDNFFRQNEAHNELFIANRLWFDRLVRDEGFTERLVSRYRELRGGVLSSEYLLNYIDETVAYLGPAIERNYSVWAGSFLDENNLLIPAARNIRSFDEAIAHLKSAIVENGEWLDANIETIGQFSHESAVKQYNP